MPRDTSEQDGRALEFIRRHFDAHGRGPTYTQVGEHLGLPTPHNANRVVARLAAKGLIPKPGRRAGRPPGTGLAIAEGPGLVVPYRGRVACGCPTPPDDADGETIDLRELLRGDGLAAFRATGTSMADEHIVEGDLLLVRECPEPDDGQVVVAVLDGEMICKKFRRTRSKLRHRLEPRAGGREPIEVDTEKRDLKILGVLHSVIRRA